MVALFGIHAPGQLERFRPDTFLGRRQVIAADLFDEVMRSGSSALKDAYFERLSDHRGAFKRTYRRRFLDFDRLIVNEWAKSQGGHAPTPDAPLTVIDVAVSDGSTTLDLMDLLDETAPGSYAITATDLEAGYVVISDRAAPARRVIVTEAAEVVQIIVPPFVFNRQRPRHRLLFPVNLAVERLAWGLARRLIARWQAGDPRVSARKLIVANADFLKRLAPPGPHTFRTWNILDPWPGRPAHILRAMNVLNPSYFTPAESARLFGNLLGALRDGGLLAAGSNGDSGTTVDGSIWRRTGPRLRLVASTGAGCRLPVPPEMLAA